MSKEKQIEEIARTLCTTCDGDTMCKDIAGCIIEQYAEVLYNAGYRKQSEGEWIGKKDYAGYGYYCSICNAVFTGDNAEWIAKEHLYCPKCGAKMKGGAE